MRFLILFSITLSILAQTISPISGGSGTAVTPSVIAANVAAVPACSSTTAGQIVYIPTGVGIYGQCNGTTQSWLFGGFSVTPPGSVSGWTAQEAPTTNSNDDGSITLNNNSGSLVLQGLTKSGTGKTSLTMTYLFEYDQTNYSQCGLVVTTPTSLYHFSDYYNATNGSSPIAYLDRWANFTTYTDSPGLSNPGWGVNPISRRRITVDGAHIIFYASPDGVKWVQLSSIVDTATEFTLYGIACGNRSSSGHGYLTLLSSVAQ